MDNEKTEELPQIVEAYVYLKNTKVVGVKGTMTSDDVYLTFTEGEFVATFRKDSIAVVIRDLLTEERETMEQPGDVKGFEIYSESGTALGFNGWALSDTTYLSEEDDYIIFMEPTVYEKTGPRREMEKPEQDNKPVENKEGI